MHSRVFKKIKFLNFLLSFGKSCINVAKPKISEFYLQDWPIATNIQSVSVWDRPAQQPTLEFVDNKYRPFQTVNKGWLNDVLTLVFLLAVLFYGTQA